MGIRRWNIHDGRISLGYDDVMVAHRSSVAQHPSAKASLERSADTHAHPQRWNRLFTGHGRSAHINHRNSADRYVRINHSTSVARKGRSCIKGDWLAVVPGGDHREQDDLSANRDERQPPPGFGWPGLRTHPDGPFQPWHGALAYFYLSACGTVHSLSFF